MTRLGILSIGGLVAAVAVAVAIGALTGVDSMPSSTASSSASSCAAPTRTVGSADQLRDALKSAHAGDVILMRDGSYRGPFRATVDGTRTSPIRLCGGDRAVLTGGGTSGSTALELDGASHWMLSGFQIRDAQKGVVVDHAVSVTVTGVTVSNIGDEGIHVRNNSTYAHITGNSVSHTGLRKAAYGEGIYIGSAKSNWCSVSDCKPDRSDHAKVTDNHVRETTAESVDIKEGTTDGVLSHNTFDGTGMTAADSWVDVKGNSWTISDNEGTHAPLDGFQTHRIVSGWGDHNRFEANVAQVDAGGYGFHLAPALDNVVGCDNKVSQSGKGLSNVPCA